MTSLEVLNSVLPSLLHNNKAATRKLTRKSIVPILSRSHQLVLVLSRPIVSKVMVETKLSMTRTVTDSLEERESEGRGWDKRMCKPSKNVWASKSWCFLH